MNRKQNRLFAQQYYLIRRLIQNDELLNDLITKENKLEVLNAKDFYDKHLSSQFKLTHIATIFKLIQRETEVAFKRISNRIHIINRFDEVYPRSFIQDLKEEAPMFIYLSGKTEILNRKLKKLAFFTNTQVSDEYIVKSLKCVQQLKGSEYVALLQFNTLLDNLLFLEFQKQGIPCIVVFRGPITKDLEGAIKKFNPGFKRGLKGMNIMSVTGPFNELMNDKIQIKTMNSLAHVSILFSEYPSDVNQDAVINNLNWKKPTFMPLLDTSVHAPSELLFTLENIEGFKNAIDQLCS